MCALTEEVPTMRVVALQTSPNTDGLTATIAEAALAGARSLGAATELILSLIHI